ncbi:hypothetical protein PsorP6_011350 [Peronosclerospora sorghi]|uniref:Uncharacterized protein n=1 Tax=Peronosclerospora sorghi TaxID=230839 RepID=A0ACC0WLJ7_9STRA|nr:hypothetical protein PsorP6_011350 [Peronosclerospora sorghi]
MHFKNSQVAEFRVAEATQRMRIPDTLRAVPAYANWVGNISLHALHLIEKQRSLVIQASATRIQLPDFQEVFGNTMGLPCAHQIANNEPIGLHAIAKNWHLHYVAATPSSPDKSLSSDSNSFRSSWIISQVPMYNVQPNNGQ